MRDEISPKHVSLAVALLYLAVVVRTAWLSDDAYITFRTVDNFVNGYGLTWNPGYRVQAYTNPLWMFLVSAVYAVTREIYYTSIFLSIAVSAAALGVVFRLARSHRQFWLGGGVLLLSKAYTDYSTSGLENPLVHLLLGVYAVLLFSVEDARRRLLAISFVGALLMTTRMDAALLVSPAVFYTAWQVLDTDRLVASGRSVVKLMGLGGTPFLLWKAFSIVYYGYPVPNTYFAKTNTTKTQFELVQQAYHYFVTSFALDPVLALALPGGLAFGLLVDDDRLRALVVGAVLYLLYVVQVGGGFMAGRFFTAPLFVAVVVLVREFDPSLEHVKVGGVVLVLLSVGVIGSPGITQTLESGSAYADRQINQYGIADERGWYYQGTGLLANKNQKNIFKYANKGRKIKASNRGIWVESSIGMKSFFAGQENHIIDRLGLADPLLSHIAAGGKIAHYPREIPPGYRASIRDSNNQIESVGLHRFYDKVRTITTGEVWSVERFRVIWKMNTGQYDHLVEEPLMTTYPAETFANRTDNGTAWDAPGTVQFDRSVTVRFDEPQSSSTVTVATDHNDVYRVEFRRSDRVVGSVTLNRSRAVGSGMVSRNVSVPRTAVETGYDTVRIVAVSGDDKYSVGTVRPVEGDG